MSERVHPHDSLSPPPQQINAATVAMEKKQGPPPGTYVIQLPKEQIYRVPTPEDAERFERLSRRKPRRSPCRRCLLWTVAAVLTAATAALLAGAAFYLAVRPEGPTFSVEGASFAGVNLTSPAPISPAARVAVRARNVNGKMGLEYRPGSDVGVFRDDVRLCGGAFPSFYQAPGNETVVGMGLRGGELALGETVRLGLAEEERRGHVALRVRIRAPVRVRIGSVRSWEVAVKVDCDLTVDKLTAGAKVVGQKCGYGFDLW